VRQCLVVDDSRVMRKVARAILETLDFDTTEVEGADGALAFCRERMPEVILLDLNLPNIDGVQFLRHLRRVPGGTRPFVVFSTMENDIARITQAFQAGANDFVLKPYDRSTIQSKLAAAGLA